MAIDKIEEISEEEAAVDAGSGVSSDGPKPGIQTSSFYVTVATFIVGAIMAFLTSKGWVTPENSPTIQGALLGVIVLGVTYVAGLFIKGRTKVSEAKAAAPALPVIGGIQGAVIEAIQPHPAASVVDDKGGIKLNDVAAMLEVSALLIGKDDEKPKAARNKVTKSLAAAAAAIEAFKAK